MRFLITGISGFVGQHLETFLSYHGNSVFGTSRIESEKTNYFHLDLLSEEQIIRLLKDVKPSHIIHLAGISNVKSSWNMKREVMEANIIATINLLEAVKKVNKSIRVITIGSSEEYGHGNSLENKLSEEDQLNPISPYGISKVGVSMLSRQYYKTENLDVIHIRPFNHIGPGQRLGFVTSDFAFQIATLTKNYKEKNQIKVGNLEAIRDFTDVRDIVEAYYEIAIHGDAGEVYNVCSGKGTKIEVILDILLSFSKCPIEKIFDNSKMRPVEVPLIIGNNKKLLDHIGWKPKISLEQSLHNIYQYWFNKIH